MSPEISDYHITFEFLIFCMIGGLGTLGGPLIGAFLLTVVSELLHGVAVPRLVAYGFLLGSVTAEALNAAMAGACAGELAGIIAYETQPIVSSDILMTTHSGVFDSLSTQIVARPVSETLTFYDNAWGYANRVVDLRDRLAAFDAGGAA